MIRDKHPPEMEPETTEEEMEEEREDEEEQTDLLRKPSREHAQSSISSSSSSTEDSHEMLSQNSNGLKFVIQPNQEQIEVISSPPPSYMHRDSKIVLNSGTGYSDESSWLEIDEIEDVTTSKTGAQNGTEDVPLAVSKPPSQGEIEEQASFYNNNGISGYRKVELRTENGNEVEDLYLERIYEKPSSHNFYCPNCQACITKVIIRDRDWVNNNVSEPIPTQVVHTFRCTSCLSFLTPIGAWLFPKLASPDPEEEVLFGPGDNVENIGIRERKTFQLSPETKVHQESSLDRPPVPDQSIDSTVTDKNKADNAITMARPSLKAISGVEINVQQDTFNGNRVDNIGIQETETLPVLQKTRGHQESEVDRAPVPNQSVSYAVTDKVEVVPDQSLGDSVADQTQEIDWAVSNSKPTHPSLNSPIAEEEIVPDKGVDGKRESTVENTVVGIPYLPHESNESVLDVDNQISTVNKPQVQNQSNGFAVLLKPELDTITNFTPDDKKGMDVDNVVVGIPYSPTEPKRGLLDRFSLPTWLNKAPIPNQSAVVVKTEIPKTPELVEATVVDSPRVSPSLGTPTVERVPEDAVGNREGVVAIPIVDPLDGLAEPQPSRYNRWEIVRSVIYGGLAESITSLGIVASAASANVTTGNIVVLALANMISGLFILGHNLKGLKSEQFRRTANETDEHEHVDRYEVVLGNRENYLLHFTLSIFSFILFGLVPPLVYGFTFTNSNDKDLKLAAVAGVSLLCIILLAIGKAYVQRSNQWDVYAKTVATYVVIAAGAGGFSYLAGDLFDKLIKKYGWFKENPAFNLHLPIPETSLSKPAWESF